MKLHYKGKYDLNPDSLPHGEHKPGYVKFREPGSSKKFGLLANILCLVLMLVLALPAFMRVYEMLPTASVLLACIVSFLALFPHELLHALCFKEDVYIYTNFAQGMLFVIGPEDMSKGRFIFMSMLPNLVFGFIPYIFGMLVSSPFLLTLGTFSIGMGAGDYINVFNAATQMPKGSRTYLYKFGSYWYMP